MSDSAVADALLDSSAGLPDLTIGCPDPADVEGHDDRVELEAQIANAGVSISLDFDVAIEMLTPQGTWVTIGTDRLVGGVGATTTRSIELVGRVPDTVVAGLNSIRCVVDASAEIDEWDEANNEDTSALFGNRSRV